MLNLSIRNFDLPNKNRNDRFGMSLLTRQGLESQRKVNSQVVCYHRYLTFRILESQNRNPILHVDFPSFPPLKGESGMSNVGRREPLRSHLEPSTLKMR